MISLQRRLRNQKEVFNEELAELRKACLEVMAMAGKAVDKGFERMKRF
jgi:hypothetical protein